ncbi:Inositolphosphorylceramide synthase subunit Kei1-domain-containing protein [Lentinula raphanica]|uniref:Inositolphosphorylceramide synthase subunit Kei1-domain-containing protein n=1 Tax=Lentinula raphanica TaxID=153919 RepID=A0AA38UFH9_9AGAR|nr:Inositolphosphorylceramide synthase subunit Kei1-domain-containing protein [Lentinula raphanica]KAJ3828340.1 Inositolphosphorylceramide synthase subunit Kei1-domain-containing protein [Lentinula raphanica]KAJ3839205.1 Inositolphosphorylceramide synthase subunit Kei1-domain-containing protein [Lentinula raphanica]KAJ3971709.1 Inositolphosphorylceramide synthase subunit Kei1-domain-containing protein [Lentinula raphanica]
MKLTLKPEWRLWPLSSFLGVLDLKTGVTMALLFAVFNKVAGVYGLIALATGAGGSFSQFSLYLYSLFALFALFYGLKAVDEEDPKHTLYFAHFFFADHVFSTAWTVFFAVVWWFQTPHDGRRLANSPAQEQIIDAAPGYHNMTDSQRVLAAEQVWNHEKGTALAVIILSWISKIYLALLIYSYATHLRKGSYRTLSRTRAHTSASPNYDPVGLGYAEEEEEETEDFYRLPLRTPNTGNSISSFADFINAPAGRKGSKSRMNESVIGNGNVDLDEEEVLFDEDEYSRGSSSRGHSKMGTDESSAEDGVSRFR